MLRKVLPIDIGTIHIIGIGGIGMSGIAEILHSIGYRVQGSDLSLNYVTERLKKMGVTVIQGHEGSNIKGVSIVVRSSAVKDTNPEVLAAREAGIPVISRSEMLTELTRFKHTIAISGSHGKTTTTSMIGALFDSAGLEPTVINGGIVNNYGSNVKIGSGDFVVVEADESDGTFIRIPSYIAVVTNIDPEHLDYYGSFASLKQAYKQFLDNLPFYGFGVLGFDNEHVRQLGASINRHYISYALNSDADLMARNIQMTEKGMSYDVEVSPALISQLGAPTKIEGMELSVYGAHNVSNSLAALAVGLRLGVDLKAIRAALKGFNGVKRRFTEVGEFAGATVIDDYAHHPTEISATLATARQVANTKGGKVIAIVQPHRYTRLHSLMNEFAKSVLAADSILIANVYSAGEQPIANTTAEVLIEKIRSLDPQKYVQKLENSIELPKIIPGLASKGDLVLFLGAGDVTKWAHALVEEPEEHKIKVGL
jgi:UDP-N-acetylmuramate--alanine ligase